MGTRGALWTADSRRRLCCLSCLSPHHGPRTCDACRACQAVCHLSGCGLGGLLWGSSRSCGPAPMAMGCLPVWGTGREAFHELSKHCWALRTQRGGRGCGSRVQPHCRSVCRSRSLQMGGRGHQFHPAQVDRVLPSVHTPCVQSPQPAGTTETGRLSPRRVSQFLLPGL